MDGNNGRGGSAASRQSASRPATTANKSNSRRPSRVGSPVASGRAGSPLPGRTPSPGPPSRQRAKVAEPRDVTQVFRQFDKNGDGSIDRNELAAVLQQLDPVQWTSRNTTLLLMSIDTNYDGHIDYAEFVSWVSADGAQQSDFRNSAGMPRSRAEVFELERQRKAAAEKGTVAELEEKKAIAVHRQEALRRAKDYLEKAHSRYDALKLEAENVSKIFMPMYELFKEEAANIQVPARQVLEHHMKVAASETPIGIQLVARAMCLIFKVHPGTKAKEEPDYWAAFLEAVLNPKLLLQMDSFDKEHIPNVVVLRELCKDERFAPDRVRGDAQQMAQTSSFIVAMCLWVQFLVKYHEAGVKRLWDQVYQAENEVGKDETSVDNKDKELKEVWREIKRIEGHLAGKLASQAPEA